MTAGERIVQVPVSLIEELADLAVFSPLVARRLRALLPQPTPIAEPMQTCGVCGRKYPASDTRATCPVCWPGFGEYTAEPPRIEDMAPGTTLLATRRRAIDKWRWDGYSLRRISDGMLQGPEDIDPSTIRDVTPPVPEQDR